MIRLACLFCAAMPLAACQPGGGSASTAAGDASAAIPDADSPEPYRGLGANETVRFLGTEPFWGGEVTGTSLTYSWSEEPEDVTIAVKRFAGRNGLSFSGTLKGAALEMTITPLECGDGMSERTYPFTVTLKLGDDLRNGCGWTERLPFTEDTGL
jgi:uncharacterized membrane protein